MRVYFSTVGIFALLLAGCTEDYASSAQNPPVAAQSASTVRVQAGKTAEEVALEQRIANLDRTSKDIVVRNTMEGAAVGAVAGCGLALLMGGDGGDCARGALAGGVVGGIGGNAVGQQAANANSQIVSLDATINKLTRVNSELGAIEGQLVSVVRSQNAEIAQLKKDLAEQKISAAAYQSRVDAIKSNRQAMDASLKNAGAGVAAAGDQLGSAAAAGEQGLDGVQGKTAAIQGRIATLRGTVAQLPD